jgi:hypothetical protein
MINLEMGGDSQPQMLASNCENNSLLEDLCQELSGIKLENGLEGTNIESLEGRKSMP